jgi:hypothetical protein
MIVKAIVGLISSCVQIYHDIKLNGKLAVATIGPCISFLGAAVVSSTGGHQLLDRPLSAAS